ncbi:MAG TPA: hypothetical protein VIY73_13350 [Polyangiaceae bacterium]
MLEATSYWLDDHGMTALAAAADAIIKAVLRMWDGLRDFEVTT